MEGTRRQSKKRDAILECVCSTATHPSAEWVYAQLKPQIPDLSLGTVYRNLNLLSDIGLLMKIHIADGSDRFDGRTDAHYHMVCEKCRRVFDIEYEELEDNVRAAAASDGYTLTRLTLTLEGVCRECSAENNT